MEEDLSVTIQLAVVILLTANLICVVMGLCLMFFGVIYNVNDKFVNALDSYHTYSISNACLNSTEDRASGALAYRICVENSQQINGVSIIIPIKVYENTEEDSPYIWDAEIITTDDCYWVFDSYNQGLSFDQVINKFMSDYADKNFTILMNKDEMQGFHILAYQAYYQGYYRIDGDSIIRQEKDYVHESLGSYYCSYGNGVVEG